MEIDPNLRSKSRWSVQKYARFMGAPGAGSNPARDWKVFTATKGKSMNLLLTENNHLIVTYDHQILENHSLWNSADYIKGIAKGDSLLFVCKLQSGCRRFRMKLESPDACAGCVTNLKNFFPIRSEHDGANAQASENLEVAGLVSMATLTQGLLKDKLPIAYKRADFATEEVNTIIKLCLSDSNFPAFVGQVDRELKKIMDQ